MWWAVVECLNTNNRTLPTSLYDPSTPLQQQHAQKQVKRKNRPGLPLPVFICRHCWSKASCFACLRSASTSASGLSAAAVPSSTDSPRAFFISSSCNQSVSQHKDQQGGGGGGGGGGSVEKSLMPYTTCWGLSHCYLTAQGLPLCPPSIFLA